MQTTLTYSHQILCILQRWLNCEPNPELHLPPPNAFIPTSYEVKALSGKSDAMVVDSVVDTAAVAAGAGAAGGVDVDVESNAQAAAGVSTSKKQFKFPELLRDDAYNRVSCVCMCMCVCVYIFMM